MGLDASVRCRCFEEHKLRPGPLPYEDLYIDEEGYLSSRKLDDAFRSNNYRQYLACYGELEDAFREWLNRPCEHEYGEVCSERVGNWSGVAMFKGYCEDIGEGRLPILSHILPDGNGGSFPSDLAEAALKELDYFDAWLDAEMEAHPTTTLIDVATGKEVWSPEDRTFVINTTCVAKAFMDDGRFCVIAEGDNEKVLFSSSHFVYEPIEDPNWSGDSERYCLFCIDSGASIDCWGGFAFCRGTRAEFGIGSRKAWCWTFANVALRSLLNASKETGNPIRWC